MGSDGEDRSVLWQKLSDCGVRASRIATRGSREELRRRAARVRISSRSKVRRFDWRAVLEAKPRSTEPAPCGYRQPNVHWQGVESLGECTGAKPNGPAHRLHRVRRSAARRVGDEHFAQTQSSTPTRVDGPDRIATIDASGDTGGEKAALEEPRESRGSCQILRRLEARSEPGYEGDGKRKRRRPEARAQSSHLKVCARS